MPPSNPNKTNHIIGQAAAIFMGTAIGAINESHQPIIAGLKQYIYSTIAAIGTIELNNAINRLAESREINDHRKDIMAITIPTTATILATLLIHWAPGTGETLLSTVPTILLSPPGFTILQIRKRLQEIQQDIDTLQINYL